MGWQIRNGRFLNLSRQPRLFASFSVSGENAEWNVLCKTKHSLLVSWKYNVPTILVEIQHWPLESKRGMGERSNIMLQYCPFKVYNFTTVQKTVIFYFFRLKLFCIHWKSRENLPPLSRNSEEIKDNTGICGNAQIFSHTESRYSHTWLCSRSVQNFPIFLRHFDYPCFVLQSL